MNEFTCYESDRGVRTQVYDPTGEAMTLGDLVDLLNAQAAEISQLRANVGAGDTAIASLEQESEVYQRERSEARQAARWLLPFLCNAPMHVQAALFRWPWLETTETRDEIGKCESCHIGIHEGDEHDTYEDGIKVCRDCRVNYQ